MDILQIFIGPVLGILIVHVILSLVYKGAEKKDKGFVFSAYKLSARRKFIRSLWTVPLILFMYIALYRFGDLTSDEYLLLGIVFALLALLDVVTSYMKWKRERVQF